MESHSPRQVHRPRAPCILISFSLVWGKFCPNNRNTKNCFIRLFTREVRVTWRSMMLPAFQRAPVKFRQGWVTDFESDFSVKLHKIKRNHVTFPEFFLPKGYFFFFFCLSEKVFISHFSFLLVSDVQKQHEHLWAVIKKIWGMFKYQKFITVKYTLPLISLTLNTLIT